MAIAADASDVRPARPGAAWIRARAAVILNALVAVWVFSSGFVMSEPAPYEPLFLLVVAAGAFGGFKLYRSTLPLLGIWVLFLPFALIAAFQGKFITISDALVYQAVSAFLFFTAYWVANYVAEAPQPRMKIIVNAWVYAAVICALAGIGGYLGIIPGGEVFTRYWRAKGFFQDPNVFAPYLIPPALYLLQRILLGSTKGWLWAGALFMVLLIGVFASFSRAAWAYLAVGTVMVAALVFFLEANGREKARMLLLSVVGTLAIVVALGGMFSIPAVQKLFEIRATGQSYDEGETGRFGRQGYAFDIALQNPLGIGPLEFGRRSMVREEPHNTYVTVLHQYGWGGGLALYAFVVMTLWRGFAALARPSANRLLMIPAITSFFCLAVEAAIIDIDHWRHFYFLGGLVWGIASGYGRTEPAKPGCRPALV